MKPDGVASVFGPGRADGPFPEHYEPLECPVPKNAMSDQFINPTIKIFSGEVNKHLTCDPKYPIVATTYRVTEHWQSGVLTRWQPWLVEAEPQLFVEMSEELAKLKSIKNGDKVKVSSARFQNGLDCVAIVTTRFRPFKIGKVTVHEVGMPWCFGWVTPKDGGDSANLLTPNVGDPNTMIPETKAFMVNVEKA
jgi:formate dehydrogenase major subunit